MGIFKAYDIRGVYGKELFDETAYLVAKGYATLFPVKTVVVGMDMRVSGPALHKELVRGLLESGVNVIDIGLTSSDMFYFAVWHLGVDGGIMISASHNPK